MSQPLVFVIYDSMFNSVFAGQVLAPLLKRLEQDKNLFVYLVSFEKKIPQPDQLSDLIHRHSRLKIIIAKKHVFFGAYSLMPAVFSLRKILNSIGVCSIIARGPLAGWIVRRALNKNQCVEVVIQARGLVAEEYRVAYAGSRGITRFLHALRACWYHSIEQYVYGVPADGFLFSIEVVSPALTTYLVEIFRAKREWCVQAEYDVPVEIERDLVTMWRERARAELGIDMQKVVYCFSGAAKPWQCPQLIVDYIRKLQNEKPGIFFLVLTPDVAKFNEMLAAILLPASYRVLSVKYCDIYRYLSAADIGVIFRQPGAVSWVARPVKAMEYEAVGLKIMHNNTVDWLIQRFGQSNY